MILSKLVSGLYKYSIKWHQQFNRDLDIYSFQIIKNDIIFQPNILYVGTVSQLPVISYSMNLTFLLVADNPLPSAYEKETLPGLNLITIYDLISITETVNLLSSIFSMDSRIIGGKSRMIESLHSNKGIQAIIDETYEVLQNPIILVDTSYKILAMYLDVTPEREDLEIQRNQGYMLESNIEDMKKSKLYEIVREKGYPYYSKKPTAPYGWITALVYVHGIEVAQIGVMDSHHPFTEADFELINFLCKIISLEFQKSDFYKTNPDFMQSFFLFELLDNQILDTKTISQRIQNLNWTFMNNMRILILFDSGRGLFEGKAQLISKQLQHLLPGSHWVIYDKKIVFLLNSQEEKLFPHEKALIEYLQINHLTASISKPFHDILEIQTYYNQAIKTYKLGQKFHSDMVIHRYEDYTIYHMMEIIASSHNPMEFYHPAIIKMQDYDNTHNTNYLETLKLYLQYINQPDIIAEKLYIHKNTVFYRINKIKEIFQINLDDGEERLKMQLTIKFMQTNF